MNLEIAYGKYSGLRFIKSDNPTAKQLEELKKLGYVPTGSGWWVCIKTNQLNQK